MTRSHPRNRSTRGRGPGRPQRDRKALTIAVSVGDAYAAAVSRKEASQRSEVARIMARMHDAPRVAA